MKAKEKKRRGRGCLGRLLLLIIIVLGSMLAWGAILPEPETGVTAMTWLKDTPIAHRGLHTTEASENSLAAFEDAVQAGYALECDLRLTADGQIMVIHDDSLLRVCGQKGRVSKLTRAELAGYTLYGGESIPTLTELLELVDGRAPLLIEIKPAATSHQVVDKMLPLLDAYPGEFAIQSFDPWVCRYTKSLRPDWQVGLLDVGLGVGPNGLRLAFDKLLINICNPDFISYRYQALTPGLLDGYRAKGTAVLAYGTTEDDIGKTHWQDRTDNLIFDREPLIRLGEYK